MTLKGIIAIILHYFTEFDRFAVCRSIMSQWLKTDLDVPFIFTYFSVDLRHSCI